ncbi:SDR family oxidoreductase [Bacillus sp. FJAT-42376]|uniref:SDR family oxidoreductase n=1 Tax=Bacillus sp. FJAT-42376 TaxID=2014076 RepID=UPI000F4FEF1B|nr:SDR family oxidoreductase [Bacillus sp. FJAT-42376]AZB43923.1 SDR family oxidoreductase [Bacillus sp. FJAT-42376]
MKHAIITAGTKGLGKKVTEAFLQKGYAVTATYRSDLEAAEAFKKEFAHLSGRLLLLQGDVTKKSDMEMIVDTSLKTFGRLDCLINNAGPYIFEKKKLADYSDEEWYSMIEGNLSAVFHLFRKAVPIMRKQQFGRIITYGFQDAGSTPGWLYRSAFSASKAGLASLTKSIAYEEAENGITANMVCPGNIVGAMKESSIENARSKHGSHTPIGRSGTGEDIARIITFLCEEQSDFITGAIIDANGGEDVLGRKSGN